MIHRTAKHEHGGVRDPVRKECQVVRAVLVGRLDVGGELLQLQLRRQVALNTADVEVRVALFVERVFLYQIVTLSSGSIHILEPFSTSKAS